MRVSVIIPSYNHQQYVSRAITSVLEQTWPEIDLIVIDDASTDGSAGIIDEILSEKGGFRFIHRRQNKGLIASLNKAIEMADGEYFCELASDDYLTPDSIEKRVRFLTTHKGCVALYADACLVKGDNETGTRIVDYKRRNLFLRPDPIPLILQGTSPVFATGMFRTEILREIGGFDSEYRYYEDLEMPLLLFLKGKIGFLDEPVLCRREHATNVSSSTSAIRIEKIHFYEKMLHNPDLALYVPLIRYQLRRSYLALGRHLSTHSGGTAQEKTIFVNGWRFAWQDIRLLWYLLKWGRKQN